MKEIKRSERAPTEFSLRVASQVDKQIGMSGLTVRKVLEASGLSSNYLYKRLRGEASFTTTDLDILAKALGCSPYDLIPREKA